MIIHNLPPFSKTKTCSVTGHREIGENFNFEQLKNELLAIYKKDYDLFLIGMAKGFDTLCFKALRELKKDCPDIKICAVIPCANQDRYLSVSEREEYAEMIENADFIAREERPYFKGCMLIRNDFLVQNCSLLYAYLQDGKKGGTYYTVKKATSSAVPVLYYGEVK